MDQLNAMRISGSRSRKVSPNNQQKEAEIRESSLESAPIVGRLQIDYEANEWERGIYQVRLGSQKKCQRNAKLNMIKSVHQNCCPTNQDLILVLFVATLVLVVNISQSHCNQLHHQLKQKSNLNEEERGDVVEVVANFLLHSRPGKYQSREELQSSGTRNSNSELRPPLISGGEVSHSGAVESSGKQPRRRANGTQIPPDDHSVRKDLAANEVVEYRRGELAQNGIIGIGENAPSKNVTQRSSEFMRSKGDEYLDDRIETRHKFTFTMNGKELALEPPQLQPTSTSTSTSPMPSAESVDINQIDSRALSVTSELLNGRPKDANLNGMRRKVNRIGEFISADYDSGFEVNGPMSEPNESLANALSPQDNLNKQHTSAKLSNFEPSSSSSSSPPPSYSSSLMLPSTGCSSSSNNDDDCNTPDNEQHSTSVSSQSNSETSSIRIVEEKNQSSRGDSGNKIISDWPKAAIGASKQSAAAVQVAPAPALAAADRHSIKLRSQDQQVAGKFSALLGSSRNLNEANVQSGEQSESRQWDSRPAQSDGSPSAQTKGRLQITSNDYPISKTPAKKGAHPKAPVYAKSRFSPLASLSSSSKAAASNEAESTGVRRTKTSSNNTNYHSDSAGSSKSSSSPSIGRSEDNMLPMKLSKFDRSERPTADLHGPAKNVSGSQLATASKSAGFNSNTSSFVGSNPISEYKTNFTERQIKSGAYDLEGGQSAVEGKSQLKTRDLSRKFPQEEIQLGLYSRPDSGLAKKQRVNSAPVREQNILNLYVGNNSLNSAPFKSTNERIGSIVRTGPILPYPMAAAHPSRSSHHLRALMPAAVALLAQAQDDQHSKVANRLKALLANQQLANLNSQTINDGSPLRLTSPSLPIYHNLSAGIDQMIATSNHLDVTHLGPQNLPIGYNLGMSESSSLNSVANLPEYSLSGQNNDAASISAESNSISSNSQSGANGSGVEDQRGNYNDLQNDVNSFETNASLRNQNSAATVIGDAPTNSRSSSSTISDLYFARPEHHKSHDSLSAASNSGSYPARNQVDSFEDLTGSDYERELADLDEEFNRQSSFRRPTNQMVSDSFLTISPERFEARRQYSRRPSYADYSGEYLSTAGSISSIIPRAYPRAQSQSWSAASPYASESSDLWTDNSFDYSPLASFITPNQYAYRWRPARYQRLTPYSQASPYLATSASEQNLQPATYNFLPASFTSALPGDTISIAISPLAAAAAAAASAIAAADRSRHQQNHGWMTFSKLAANTLAPSSSSVASSAAQASAPSATLPAAALPAYTAFRPNPYAALSSVPIYAISPRPQPAPISSSASGGAAPSFIPATYFPATGPTLIAYRPTGILPPSSLLTAASFAYPLRLPIGSLPRPAIGVGGGVPTRSVSIRPFYSDLQLAESKFKTNPSGNQSSTSDGRGFGGKAGGTLSAMAKSLSKKMFGSSSQIRPQHVAPPSINPMYDLFAQTPNNSSTFAGLGPTS